MDMQQVTLFKLMQQKMAYHSERQGVLAQNIANANTPNYIPKDIEKPDFGAMVQQSASRLQMTTTDDQHIAPKMQSSRFDATSAGGRFERTPSGNEVILEQQISQMAGNSSDYIATTNLYRKMGEIMRLGLGNSGQ